MDVLQSYISPSRVGAPAAPKGKAATFRQNPDQPASASRSNLIVYFAAWKTILLAIAALSPGPGYDTSSQILARQSSPPSGTWLGRAVEGVVLKLTRWDAIYYASIAERGYVHEQEWAFGGAFGRLPALLAPGIFLSHLFHFLGVLFLFQLTFDLLPVAPSAKRFRTASTAACLHIVSPAGLFLSAPYSESAFAFWTFAGTASYVLSVRKRLLNQNHGTDTVLAGFFFGIAAATRSNGLFAGLIFLVDALSALHQQRTFEAIWNLLPTIIAGSLIAVGFATPQINGYVTYCTGGQTRPWCSSFPPSIYTWVQSRYWDVGFLRYWTPNNIPLFALAAPMIAWLTYTGLKALRYPRQLSAIIGDNPTVDISFAANTKSKGTKDSSTLKQISSSELQTQLLTHVLPRLALSQLTLVVLATTSFHVQIINRLASAYPVWYIVLAIALHAEPSVVKSSAPALTWLLHGSRARVIVQAMVVYALVQGGLFASFLPPA